MSLKIAINIIAIYFCLFCPSNGTPPLQSSWKEFEEKFDTDEDIIDLSKMAPRFRLPKSVIPYHYIVEIQPLLEESNYGDIFTAPGRVTIQVECVENTNQITMNSIDINILEETVTNNATGVQVPVFNRTFDIEKEFYTINLNEDLITGQKYDIHIEFIAPVSRSRLTGIYVSNYTTNEGEIRNLAVTKLGTAPDARRAFPNFCEPALKATFQINIIRREDGLTHSLANMRQTDSENYDAEGRWKIDRYEDSPVMSSYLVCFTVSDFVNETSDPQIYHVPNVIWGPKPLMDLGAGKFAPDYSARVLKYFDEFYGINHPELEYPIAKMDKFYIPHFASGAMEKWGLNTYRDTRLMYIPEKTLYTDKVAMATTISHEFAHNWFGNFVTLDWWDDLWLNEGFATYIAQFGVDFVFPDFLATQAFVFNAVQSGMQADVLPSSHPIHPPLVESIGEIRAMFNTIIYSKGGALCRMMSAILGEEKFRTGIENYLLEKLYAAAHQDELFAILNAQNQDAKFPSDETMKTIMDTWTLQQGFPIVKLSRGGSENSQITLTQEKFVLIGSEDPLLERWSIPISFVQEGDENLADISTKHWLLNSNTELVLPENFPVDNWVLFNPSETGYYRVLYDSVSYTNLIEQLRNDHLTIEPMSRSMLIDDSLNLAFNGYMQLGETLEMLTYLENEVDYVPWISFLNNMQVSYRMISRTSAFYKLRKFFIKISEKVLGEIGYNIRDTDYTNSARTILLRTRLADWSCNVGNQECIQETRNKFEEWKESPQDTHIIFPDMQPITYCTAVANGNDETFRFVLESYKNANYFIGSINTPHRINLLRALACSKQSFRLNELLQMALDLNSEIPSNEKLTAFQAIGSNSLGTQLTFTFIRNNFSILIKRYGPSMFSNIISTLSNYMISSQNYQDLDRFINENSDALSPVMGSLRNSLSNIEKNIKWMQDNYDTLNTFLDRY